MKLIEDHAQIGSKDVKGPPGLFGMKGAMTLVSGVIASFLDEHVDTCTNEYFETSSIITRKYPL